MHPQSFKLDSLDDCIRAAQALNKDTDKILNEGFVVVDQNWRRLKIKSPEYVGAHKLINNRVASKEKLLEVIMDHPEDVDGVCEIFPEMTVYLRYYQYKVVELEHDVDRFIRYVRSLFEEYNHDTRAVALTIKDLPLAAFGFEALKSNADAKGLLANIRRSRYLRLIPDYVENDVIHMISR